jgi:hypothetical protein
VSRWMAGQIRSTCVGASLERAIELRINSALLAAPQLRRTSMRCLAGSGDKLRAHRELAIDLQARFASWARSKLLVLLASIASEPCKRRVVAPRKIPPRDPTRCKRSLPVEKESSPPALLARMDPTICAASRLAFGEDPACLSSGSLLAPKLGSHALLSHS